MKDAYHEAKAGMNERKAEDAAAKREHEEAQRTGCLLYTSRCV